MATEGYADFEGAQTWFRVYGELPDSPAPGSPAPLVVLHGGPGATHHYLTPIAELSDTGRAVVLYDQLGNGNSTHFPERGADFWTVDLFVRELANLIDHLGLGGSYHVLGQSWGGFLAQEHAITQPAGLRSLVLSNTAASFPDFATEANALRRELPPDVEATLRRHEADGTTDSAAYADACMVFYQRHVCRLDPWPAGVTAGLAKIDEDPTVYHTMNGPSEFHVIGSLKAWDITDRLHEIATPTLLVSGLYDEATPLIVEQVHERIPGAEWALFEESSHMPHVEEPEAFLERVETFLRTID